jgi:TetR/AcrR family transcriptional regulator
MGISERKEREKEQRRQWIIDAAEKVIFSKGLAFATMDEIAAVAEFSKGALYLYFKNKEDLYLSIHARGARILREMFEKAASEHKKGIDQVLAIGYAYYEYSKKYSDYYNAMIYYESHPIELDEESTCAIECMEEGEAVLRVLANSVQKGIDDRSIRPDVDPFKTALILWGQSMGVIQLQSLKGENIGERFDINFEELIDTCYQMMRKSLVNEN